MIERVALAALLAVSGAEASDWPQWRGLARDGVSPDAITLPEPPSPWNPRWRSTVGSGQSSPVVSGDVVFVFGREGDEEVARALDVETGRVRWRQGYPAPYSVYPGAKSFGSGPKSTPVFHDGRLFTLGIGGTLSCFDAATGRLLWQKDFAGRFPQAAPPFGTSMSPLMTGGTLIVHAGGHQGGALIAFDPATGTEKWALEGDGPSYSSPIVASFQGQEHVVVQVHRKIIGVDPASGGLLWSVPFVTPCDQNIVTPLLAKDLLIVSSLDKGTMAIRLERDSDNKWQPQVKWQTQEVSMYMSTPVLSRGQVIGLSHRRKGQFFALDPETGAIRWKSEGGQGENAAFLVMGESVLALRGDGRLLVLPADAALFAPLASHQLAEGSTFAHPVPTPSGILIKDEASLSLFGASPKDPAADARAGGVRGHEPGGRQ